MNCRENQYFWILGVGVRGENLRREGGTNGREEGREEGGRGPSEAG